MSLHKRILSVCVCFTVALTPTASWAQKTNAPPGNAGVDEYLETVPQADGNRPSINKPEQPALSQEAAERLRAQGSDGEAAARLAELTSPEAARQGDRAKKPGAGSAAIPQVGTGSGGESVAERVVKTAVGSNDGMGPALPLILAFVAGLGVALVLMRRRGA